MPEAAKNMQQQPIRSYVVRGGRLTTSQQKAIEMLWSEYGLDHEKGLFKPEKIFCREAELVLEIGFGMGDSLVEMAKQHPYRDYVGVDVHPPGIGTILRAINTQGLNNIRILKGDAVKILVDFIPDNVLDRIQIFFPDPWHKKRHHKRRMIQAAFVEVMAIKLRNGGIIHLATDWENYAEQMMEIMSESPSFKNLSGNHEFAKQHERVETKFERRGRRLGHGVWDMLFEKNSSEEI